MSNENEELYCGIIMPIASMFDYTSEHWSEVKSIIIESTKQVDGYNFKTEIVSNSDGEIDVIHKRIIQNLYNADIVVCDISGKNPNVLFELGMRLTFDKPTILIKDDSTDFIFDTGVIEHLTYPKDLRFSKIVNFKKELASRIKHTLNKYKEDPSFSTFLGSFGEFKVPALNQTTVSDVQQLMLDEISFIRKELSSFKKETATSKMTNTGIVNDKRSKNYNRVKEFIEKNYRIDWQTNNEEILNDINLHSFLKSLNLNINNNNLVIIDKIISELKDDSLPF